MKHKALAILLVVLLGGMTIYYNQSVPNNTEDDKGVKVDHVDKTK